MQERLAALLGGGARQVLVESSDQTPEMWGWFERARAGDDQGGPERAQDGPALRPAAAGPWQRGRHHAWRHMSLIASVQLADGRWLNVETRFPRVWSPPRCRP